MKNNLTIYKANELIEATYTLAQNEQRVLLACIGQINPTLPINAFGKFTLLAKDFAETFQLNDDGAYKELLSVATTLQDKKFVIQNPTSGADGLKTSWVSGIEYTKGAGVVSVWLSQPLLHYLIGLKEQFTRYELQNVSSMKSYYGVRLYELLVQYRTIGRREIKIDWLKERLEITHLYSDLSNFKKYVIDAAIKDINKNSDLFVHPPIYTKTGRNVTGVVFDFKPKQPTTKKQPKQPTPTPTDSKSVDSIEEFATMRKRFGENLPVGAIPADIIKRLKAQGRW
jgi:plasmid replication initiation protein